MATFHFLSFFTLISASWLLHFSACWGKLNLNPGTVLAISAKIFYNFIKFKNWIPEFFQPIGWFSKIEYRNSKSARREKSFQPNVRFKNLNPGSVSANSENQPHTRLVFYQTSYLTPIIHIHTQTVIIALKIQRKLKSYKNEKSFSHIVYSLKIC